MKRVLFISILVLLVLGVTTGYAYVLKGSERNVETVDIKIDSKRYVLLLDACRANGIEWEWDSISRRITLRKNAGEAVFLIGSKYYYTGEKIKKLSAPVRMKDGAVYIPRGFARYSIKRLFPLKTVSTAPRKPKDKRPSAKKFKIKKVVIDPGHGGKDPGAIGRTGLKEKDVVLDVSKRIKKELEKKGIEVIMTRDSDRFISLSKRAKIANEKNADLFVSIHANANRARWLRGFEVYTLSEATDDNARALAASENSVLEYEEGSIAKHTKNLDAIIWDLQFTEERRESIELAGFICRGASKKTRLKNRDIKSARFYVLKGAEMPAVLVELSYLSNKKDERNLKKSSYKQKLAKGIAEGMMDYKEEYERTNGFSR
jgi:N-acetylmuramoyl-L-alanine amidase